MFRIEHGRIIDDAGAVLFGDAVRPLGFVMRLRGLIGRAPLSTDQAWWFDRCAAVHTMGMTVAIDVVHLDGGGRILAIRDALAPWRVSLQRACAQVLELAPGAAASAHLRSGQRLRFVS